MMTSPSCHRSSGMKRSTSAAQAKSHRIEMLRNARRLRDIEAVGVEDGGGIIQHLAHDGRAAGSPDGHVHFGGDRGQRVLQDFEFDGVQLASRLRTPLCEQDGRAGREWRTSRRRSGWSCNPLRSWPGPGCVSPVFSVSRRLTARSRHLPSMHTRRLPMILAAGRRRNRAPHRWPVRRPMPFSLHGHDLHCVARIRIGETLQMQFVERARNLLERRRIDRHRPAREHSVRRPDPCIADRRTD